MFEEGGGWIECPVKKVSEYDRELVGPSLAWQAAWLMVRMKSGISCVEASMSPRPTWTMVM